MMGRRAMKGKFRQVAAALGALAALLAAPRAGAVLRPVAADFAPDRFHFAPLDLEKVGREIPFIYDAPGAARQAKGDRHTAYETWVGLGLQLLRERDFDIAADCFRAALVMSNDAPDAVRHLLARSLLLDQRPREADAVWEELCRRNAQDAEAYWQLGYSFFLRDELDEAMSRWRALDALAPAHPFPPLVIGLVHWSLRQMPEAEREIIISTRRSKAPAQTFLAMAAIASANRDLPESVGWLRRGFDRLPPFEQRRWYVRPQFDVLRHSGHPLVAELEKEFRLNQGLAAGADGEKPLHDGFDIAIDHSFGATIDFAPMREIAETNAPPEISGLQVLRLAPRIVPK